MVFGSDYSEIYDSLYTEHDYENDVCNIIKYVTLFNPKATSLADFGCGSGTHLNLLSRHYHKTVGFDISQPMLNRACTKFPHLHFEHGDVKNHDLNDTFDVITMNSAVMCYQLRDDDVMATMQNVRRHLNSDGLFVFDVWYGPAVLSRGVHPKVKKYSLIGSEECVRVVEPSLNVKFDACTCLYTWFHNGHKHSESHIVRYFFYNNINLFLKATGFELLRMCDTITGGSTCDMLDNSPWHVTFVARAI